MPSINDVIKEIQNWLRLAIFIHSGLKESLLAILHNDDNDPTYTGLPRDPVDLYTELNTTHLQTLKQLLHPRRNQRKVLTQKQWDILFPPNQQETNTDEFDVTLIVILIINCAKIPQPVTGWNPNRLTATDKSKAANVLRARELRNYISHTHYKEINAVEFTTKWKEGEDIVKGLGSNFDTNSMKTIPLDPTTSTLQRSLINSLDKFCKQEVKQNAEQIDIIAKFMYCQNLRIQQIDTTVAGHSYQLNQQSAAVAGHSYQLNQQGATVAGHSYQLNQQGATVAGHSYQLNQQGATVAGHSYQLNQQGATVAGHSYQLNQQGATVAGHSYQLNQQGATVAGHSYQLNQQDATVAGHSYQLNQQGATVAGHSYQLNQQGATVAGHSYQLNQQGATVAGHSDRLNQQGATVAGLSDRLNQQGTTVAGLSDRLNQQGTTVAGHSDRLNQQGATVAGHSDRLNQQGATVAGHSDRLNQQGATVAGHSDRLNQQGATVAGLSDRLNQQGATVAGHSDQLSQQNATLVGLAKKVDEFQKPSLSTEEEEKRTSLHNIGRTNSDPQNDQRIKVVCQIGHGCILKVRTNFQIEKVSYRPLKEKANWSLIRKFHNESSDEEVVTYEERRTKDGDVFLKVVNLEIIKYELMVETNGLKLQTTARIYAEEDCGHVICVDNTFAVLAPPFGRLKDSDCCKNGIDGNFVEKSMTLNTRISEGPLDKNMTVEQFTDFCETYKDRNFPDTKDVITFLPLDLIEDPDVQKTARIFHDFLLTRHGLRAVVSHADNNKYLQSVSSFSDFLKMDICFLNRLTVFDDSTACVMNIRVVNKNGDISKELEHIASDLKYSAAANKNLKPSCYSIGLLCFPTTPRHEVEEQMKFYFSEHGMEHIHLCYIAKEDLENLSGWWYYVLEKELKRLELFYQCKKHSLEQKNKALDTILAQTITTIAMTNVLVTPTLAADPGRQLKTLLLNTDQIEAVKNMSKRKLVMGNFGSGKSIVGDEIFKQLYLKCRSLKRKLVYAVWEKHSLLEVYKHILFEKLQKEYPYKIQDFHVEIGNPYNLSGDNDVTFLEFLTDQLENNELIDIIIDELPSESVHQSEVPILQKLLNDHPQSSIVIIPQSVIIDRTKSSGGQPMNIGRNCLMSIGLDVFKLHRIMRNTIEITSVLKFSQQVVQDCQNVLNISDMKSKNVDISDIEISEPATYSKKRKIDILETETYTKMMKIDNLKPATYTEMPLAWDEPTDKPISIDVDKFAIHLHNPDKLNRNSSTQLSTLFKFFKVINGNKVTDKKPILLNLPTEFNLQDELSAKILCLILQEICHLNNRSPTLLIGSSIEEIRMISYALSFIENFNFDTFISHLQGRVPSIDEKRKIMSTFLKGSSILTDNSGVKGLECENVIIFIQRNEHFQRHLFIETLARANVQCYIFTYGDHTEFQVQQETIEHVFKGTIEEGLIDEIIVTTYVDHSAFGTSHQFKERIFRVNKAYCDDMEHDTTIHNYFEKFGTDFPTNLSSSHFRDSLKKLTSVPSINPIVHEVEHEDNLTDGYRLHSTPQTNNTNTNTTNKEEKEPWHESFSQSQRKHMVDRLVADIISAISQGISDPIALKNHKMDNLIHYAQRVEDDMYKNAANKEDYFHLLAEKVYKIQKELEEKRLERIRRNRAK